MSYINSDLLIPPRHSHNTQGGTNGLDTGSGPRVKRDEQFNQNQEHIASYSFLQ